MFPFAPVGGYLVDRREIQRTPSRFSIVHRTGGCLYSKRSFERNPVAKPELRDEKKNSFQTVFKSLQTNLNLRRTAPNFFPAIFNNQPTSLNYFPASSKSFLAIFNNFLASLNFFSMTLNSKLLLINYNSSIINSIPRNINCLPSINNSILHFKNSPPTSSNNKYRSNDKAQKTNIKSMPKAVMPNAQFRHPFVIWILDFVCRRSVGSFGIWVLTFICHLTFGF